MSWVPSIEKPRGLTQMSTMSLLMRLSLLVESTPLEWRWERVSGRLYHCFSFGFSSWLLLPLYCMRMVWVVVAACCCVLRAATCCVRGGGRRPRICPSTCWQTSSWKQIIESSPQLSLATRASRLLDQSSVASTHRFLYYSYIEPTYRLHQIALSITQLAFSQSPQYIYLRKAYEKGKLLYAGCVQL